jgi:predicted dehydrogenase
VKARTGARSPRTAGARCSVATITIPVPSERGRWDTYYPAFAAAVRGTGDVPVDPWSVVAALEVIDAARASAGEARSVEMH